MSSYEVKVIKPGYTTWLSDTEVKADGTITLITGPKNIIVDTGLPQDRDTILTALQKENLKPEDISFVICTHGHSDHIGNINLFPNATVIVSHDVCKGDVYTIHNFASGKPYIIDEDIEVVPTPGHTGQDVSVIVRTRDGIVAVVGDLFECEADLKDELIWRKFSSSPEIQETNRLKILETADYIVPGHGSMFPTGASQATR